MQSNRFDPAKVSRLLAIIYILMIFWSFPCTFLAIINDKFGERIDTYAILYGLMVIPQITLNIISRYHAYKSRRLTLFSAGDVLGLVVSVSALAIMLILGATKHDLVFMLPHMLIIVLNLGIACYCKCKK